MAAANDFECLICLEENKVFRVLDCTHFFCERCCEKLKSNDNDPSITCPIDRKRTRVPSFISSLPIKLVSKVECQCCSNLTSLKELFWCIDCNEVVCSYCFMKRHRKHDYIEVDDGSILKDCHCALKPVGKRYANVKQFCESLSLELEKRLLHERSANSLIRGIEKVVGQINDDYTVAKDVSINESMYKKLHLATKMLTAVLGESFDYDQLKVGPDDSFEFRVPNMSDVLNLFFVPKTSEIAGKMPKGKIEETPVEKPQSSLCLQMKHSVRVKVPILAMCAIPNECVTLISDEGLHKFDEKLNHVYVRTWPSEHILKKPKSDPCVYVVFNKFRQSIFLTVRNNRFNTCVEEYKTNSCEFTFHASYEFAAAGAKQHLTKSESAPLLLSVLGKELLVAGISDGNGNEFVGLYQLKDKSINRLQLWGKADQEAYYDIANDQRTVYIMGDSNIYVFSVILPAKYLCLCQTLRYSEMISPFFTFNGLVMMMNPNDNNKLISVKNEVTNGIDKEKVQNKSKQTTQTISIGKNSNVSFDLMCSNDRSVFIFNYENETLFLYK